MSIMPSTFYSASGTGTISSRTSWTKDAVQLLFRCGSTLESHSDRAIGEFMLYGYGTWLLAQAKLATKSGISQDAIDHNCLTCDGLPQTWTQDQAKIIAQEDTPSYTYLTGDVTGAYVGQFNNYVRELFFLKPNYLLVRDTLTPTNPTSKVAFHLQTLVSPSPITNGFAATSPGANLFGLADAPLPTFTKVLKSADQVTPTYRTDWSPNASGNFLVALEAAPPTQAAPTMATPTANGDVTMVVCGGTTVAWSAKVTPTFVTPGPGLHVVIGLKASAAYAVGSLNLTTSAAGILSWNSPQPAGTTLTLSTGSAPPPPLTITSLSPLIPAVSGTTVTVTGTGFTGATTLVWGTTGIVPTFVSTTQLTFPAPPVSAVTVQNLKAVLGNTTSPGLMLTISPSPKTFVASGSLTLNPDGTLSGTLTLTPK